jgi:hypothetical protein
LPATAGLAREQKQEQGNPMRIRRSHAFEATPESAREGTSWEA